MKDSKATDKTKEMGRILLTALEEAATIVSEEDVNDEGNPVKPSPLPAHGHQYYCGQQRPIPGSDGRCGPTNGPQCPSCVRFTQVKSQALCALSTNHLQQPLRPTSCNQAHKPVYRHPTASAPLSLAGEGSRQGRWRRRRRRDRCCFSGGTGGGGGLTKPWRAPNNTNSARSPATRARAPTPTSRAPEGGC